MDHVMASHAAEWAEGTHCGPDVRLCRPWKSDSRDVGPGDACVALRGEKTDGHLYVHNAMERGAKLLLVDISRVEELMLDEPEFSGVSVIAVQDTATALPVIARDYLKRVSPRLTGITGSVGKTTTRELTVSLLKTEKKVHSAIRSFNTVVGCSLTILAMAEDTEVLVLEFGTNHFGEIREMVSLFPPETAVITEVAPAHLEGFENIEGVLRAKMEICESKMLDTIIYNSDNMLLGNELSYKYNNINKIGVGKCAGADLKITDQKLSLDDGGAALASFYDFMGKSVELRANLFGLQHSYNVGYAFLTALHYGISEDAVQEALSGFVPIAGRGICKKLPGNKWVIDEAYNANPSSMGAALKNTLSVAESSSLTPYAVLGGMRELGRSSAMWHQEILKMITGFRRVLLLGGEWFDPEAVIPANAERYMTFEELTPLAEELAGHDSVVLVKGSNSYGLKRFAALLTEG